MKKIVPSVAKPSPVSLPSESGELKEMASAYAAGQESKPMIRTQIYLTKAEHNFLQAEAARREQPMAALIRSLIDDKMEIPKNAWLNNPILEPGPPDRRFAGHEDGAINHDHYIYGCPKKFVKEGAQWVPAPPLAEDDSAAGARRHRPKNRLKEASAQ